MRSPGLSPSSYNALDSYNSTKNFLIKMQTCLRHHALRHLNVGILEWTAETGQGGRKTGTEAAYSPTLTLVLEDVIVVKGWGAALRQEQQKQQVGQGGYHTLRLDPGSETKKWHKKISVPKPISIWQTISQMLNLAILFPSSPPSSKILNLQFKKGLKVLSSQSD